MKDFITVCELVDSFERLHDGAKALSEKTGKWSSISSRVFVEQVRALALGLKERGDERSRPNV